MHVDGAGWPELAQAMPRRLDISFKRGGCGRTTSCRFDRGRSGPRSRALVVAYTAGWLAVDAPRGDWRLTRPVRPRAACRWTGAGGGSNAALRSIRATWGHELSQGR